MPRYDYDCAQCGELEVEKGLTAPHPLSCPQCGRDGLRHLVRGAQVLVRGGQAGRQVDGDCRLRRELVLHNSDGSESVYGTVAQALRDDRERGVPRRLREKNWQHLQKLGYVLGTPQAARAQSIEDVPLPPLHRN